MTTPPAWSFRGGDWFGVLGEHAVVALPPSQKARVAALWELVDDGAGFQEVLDALISTGLRGLPGFVLVGREGDRTRVLVRGAARVLLATADEAVHVEGDDATTWVERTVIGVTRTRIEVADEQGADQHGHGEHGPDGLAVTGGLVRLAFAESPPVQARPEVLVSESDPEPEPEPEPDPEQGSEPPWVPTDGPATEAMPAIRPVRDHDGLTRSGGLDPALLGQDRPGIPGQPPAPSVTSRPVARLVFSSGDDVLVDRSVLVGRAPEARRHTQTEEPRLVAVPSVHHEISSTHLEIRPGSGADHGSAVVTDLGSTNGTLLVQPGLPPEGLHPGVAVQLIPGAVVDLGDGVTIQVVDP